MLSWERVSHSDLELRFRPHQLSRFIETLVEWLEPLSLVERAKFLNFVMYELTIRCRDKLSKDGDSSRFCNAVNELQHKLSSQVAHYLDNDETTVYPIDVLSAILFEIADHHRTVPMLQGSLQAAKDRGF